MTMKRTIVTTRSCEYARSAWRYVDHIVKVNSTKYMPHSAFSDANTTDVIERRLNDS